MGKPTVYGVTLRGTLKVRDFPNVLITGCTIDYGDYKEHFDRADEKALIFTSITDEGCTVRRVAHLDCRQEE